MTAYVVMIRKSVSDEAGMATYAQLAKPAREGHPVRNLVAYGDLTMLEGDPVAGVFIHEFPSVADAEAWYNSDAYQAALPYRQASADYQVLIVEGSTPA